MTTTNESAENNKTGMTLLRDDPLLNMTRSSRALQE